MTGNSCLLDTSVIIHVFKNNDLIIQKLKTFENIYVSTTVVGELYFGAYASANPVKHIDQITSFLADCAIVTVSKNYAIKYGQIKALLKQKGTPIPENDIWIAAVAIDLNLPLFTPDNHFILTGSELVSF